MCLLITAPAGVTIEDEWLRDFYRRNDDGYGFMYAQDNTLHVLKRLGTVEQFIADWRSLEHLDRAVHLRMRTHGDIDLVNCHPYWVTGYDNENELPLAMMHNGVLSSGNHADTTKSDTWHYINDVLKPLLAKYPHLIQDPVFQQLVEEHIGAGNRFVFLDSFGRMVTLNYAEGVLWEGMWLSNTYAWSPPRGAENSYGYNSGDAYWRDHEYFQTQATPRETEDFEIVEAERYEDEVTVYDICDHLYTTGFHRAGNADELMFKFLGIYGTKSLHGLVERLLERECSEEGFLDELQRRILITTSGYDTTNRVPADTIPLFDRGVDYGA